MKGKKWVQIKNAGLKNIFRFAIFLLYQNFLIEANVFLSVPREGVAYENNIFSLCLLLLVETDLSTICTNFIFFLTSGSIFSNKARAFLKYS